MFTRNRQSSRAVAPLIAALALVVLAARATAENPAATELTGRTMGTTYRIKYWGGGSTAPNEVRESVDSLLARFNRQMSTYREDSELSRFNRAAAGEWFPVSPETAHVVAKAIEYCKLTEGTLDVTVAPVLRLWHFGGDASKKDAAAPGAAELHQAMKLVGAGHLSVRREPPALRKDAAGVEVDLSAIAPGYAVDLLIELLDSLGFANAMVEIGGEVRAAGTRVDGTPWRIGVEHVEQRQAEFAEIVPLENLALTTAGDYRNFLTAGGRRYTHIIDPRTGQALAYRGAAVTVLAETCLAADALDTALLVMGPEDGHAWCVKHKVAALFQSRGADGRVDKCATPRFEELVGRE